MNYPMIRYILGWVVWLDGALMLLPCLIALIYQEQQGFVYLTVAVICSLLGFLGTRKKPDDTEIFLKDGMVAVALSWLVMSLFGAIPFRVTGEIPHYVDALFEIVSGFTTTGASILSDVEAVSHTSLFWRSFSHWTGGMGVLVFLLMLMPVKTGSSMNLMKAESPGYNVSKFVPRVRNTARILYKIYIAMTLLQIAILLVSGMHWFDTLCITFGSAGTGGFAVLNSGLASYTPFQQVVVTVFMIAFGVNFGFYYYLLGRKYKAAFGMEEVRLYIVIILVSAVLIIINIYPMYPTIGETVRQAFFQVGSIITTTGFSTTDFNKWPSFSKNILVLLMLIGACAGSTGGGIKVSRVLILFRSIRRKLKSFIHPYSVKRVRVDGKSIEEDQVREISVYLAVYVLLFIVSMFIVSIDNFSFETNFTAVAATFNNIGPGLAGVGPTSNFGDYSVVSKIVLIFDMLAGRLELFPLLLMLDPQTWRSKA